MSDSKLRLAVNLERIAAVVNVVIPLLAIIFAVLAFYFSPYLYVLAGLFLILTIINVYFRHFQKDHTLLANFGIIAELRYLFESIGPEMRQYFYLSDTEEKPFNRTERSEVYRRAKGIDSSEAFGTLSDYSKDSFKLKHSFYPKEKKHLKPYSLVFGSERDLGASYAMKNPVIISAMSYGSLGSHAIRALARGARKSGILMNTGEGGYPKYHLKEGCDLLFQMGTAKFGVRNDDGSLNESKLKNIAELDVVKMIEIKLSQGAKPGKGGLLPKEKITDEIAELRGVPKGEDVVSPAYHSECVDAEAAIRFIAKIQEITQKPVGIKFCLGRKKEFSELVGSMKALQIFPDYISVDGAEGGTGAAPKSFMDDVGVSIFPALKIVNNVLIDSGIRKKTKLLAAGKLIDPGRQIAALSLGADAVYSARGFLLAIGCIQALQCNKNTCPVGITTQDQHLQAGLDIELKSERVANYVNSLMHEYKELIAAMGVDGVSELSEENLFLRSDSLRN